MIVVVPGDRNVLGDGEAGRLVQNLHQTDRKQVGGGDDAVAIADRWLPRYLESGERAHQAFIEHFAPGRDSDEVMEEFAHVDTSIADYVWLPIRFDGDRPIIEWREQWSPEEYDGI